MRMIDLVDSLLNVSRIESGRIIIDPKPTNLNELVKEVLKDLEEKIQKKEHKLIFDAHKKIPEVKIDPKLIRHVFMNLLTNAVKYTPPKGEIAIFISVGQGEVISQISDNGEGIPEKNVKRLFHETFTTKKQGTGLGLWLCEHIIRQMGGKMKVESKVGKGTTFIIYLPREGE